MSKQIKTTLLMIFSVFIFFIPFFWNPVNINIHGDLAGELLEIIRLGDARFSLSANPSDIYANPVYQIFSNHHSAIRVMIFFPVIYAVDKLGITLNEQTFTSIYIIVGFLAATVLFLFSQKIFGQKKAYMLFSLLCSIPYVLMLIKVCWWNFYTLLPVFAGLYFLDDYFKNNRKRSWIFFCLSACLCILSNPGFYFNFLFFIIFALVFLFNQTNSWKKTAIAAGKLLLNPWTWAPILVIALEILAAYLGQRAGYGFGIMMKILSKGELANNLGLKTLANFLLENFGLTGFILFPAIIIAYTRSIFIFKKADIYLKASVIFFTITFTMLFIFGGSGAYIYEVYLSALLILIYALLAIKSKFVRYALFVIIVAGGLAQALAYNFHYSPKGFLTDPKFFILNNRNTLGACATIWCPYHFADLQNIGLKTLGFVARDYLAISPVPYISKEYNFHQRQDEFFFNSSYNQSPTIHIGRRLNRKIELIDKAKIIVVYTPEILKQYPFLTNNASTTAAVFKYIEDHPRFKLEAIITIADMPVIKVYELDGTKPTKTFPVEIYDKLFDQKYSNLKNLSHIDLGNI